MSFMAILWVRSPTIFNMCISTANSDYDRQFVPNFGFSWNNYEMAITNTVKDEYNASSKQFLGVTSFGFYLFLFFWKFIAFPSSALGSLVQVLDNSQHIPISCFCSTLDGPTGALLLQMLMLTFQAIHVGVLNNLILLKHMFLHIWVNCVIKVT